MQIQLFYCGCHFLSAVTIFLGMRATANHNLRFIAGQRFAANMAAVSMQCNLHSCNNLPKNEPVYAFTTKRYDTFVEYTKQLSALCKYPEKTVALANSKYLQMRFEQAGEIYYHKSCYKIYTNDVKAKRAVILFAIFFLIHCNFMLICFNPVNLN